ncbi:DUF995 domain-containing protein [Phaeobacter sp. HF9A]|uniref:DUF995 domain-containing protein n=1 Tax=Phaeobacter sp. HF9A TaxID=2721561 RepID=UPI001431E3BF|nr:DUF995 domain-containing protein [Phaeobacter sp. HF9A]NIZ12727.1 DUF995 domain-containing protein [Phaeobacter sp. HF9A]
MSISSQIMAVSLVAIVGIANPSAMVTKARAGMLVTGGSQPLSPEFVYRVFAGHSADWGGGSYAFWAPDGVFYSVNTAEQSLGYGKWYATSSGRMCYEADWVWRQDFGVEQKAVKTCTRFRMDPGGEMWSTTGNQTGPWFPFTTDNLTLGNSVAPIYSAMYSRMGLPLRQ